MGWTDWIGPAVGAGLSLYSMFSSDDMDPNTEFNQRQARLNRSTTEGDWKRLFDYWLGQQAHWAQRSAQPLDTPEWQNQSMMVEDQFEQQAGNLERAGVKRGLTGGAIGEGLGKLEQAKLQSLEQTLNNIMMESEKSLYSNPPPTHGQANFQSQMVPGSNKGETDSGMELSGFLPLMEMFTNKFGGNSGQGGTINTGASSWLMTQATGNSNNWLNLFD